MTLAEAKIIIENNINKKVEVIKRLTGGMRNYTYLIKVEEKLFTYRIPGKKSHVFIDRYVELENIKLVEHLNLNCQNVYFNCENGHKMSLYIHGDDLSKYSVDFNLIASSLKKLHNSKIRAVNDYDKEEKLNYYEKLVTDLPSKEYLVLKSELLNKLSIYKDVEKVFCHGDSQKANWILGTNLHLLDWEYSGNNDPYYDIACFGNVDFQDAVTLLKYYLERTPTKIELNRLIVNRFFQCLQWYNVALYKEQIGLSIDLNIDFKAVSLKYLKLAGQFNDMLNE